MCCSSFFDVWLLITSLWYLLTNVLFTLLWCITSDYLPLVSFDHCIVHPSLMYDFWLPPFFWPMCCSPFFDVWLLITSLWYLLTNVLFTLLWCMTSDYLPLVSFDQCVVHPSLMYDFWLPPFGIFWPMCCSPFFDVWLLITSLWYLLTNVLFTLLWCMASDYLPLVSFDQCVVHPSLMYDFWLPPFGIFWPMCCSPFFDVWLLITSLWYLLTNVLFTLLWCMVSDYLPLVSFDQCVVHPSLMYDFWLPPFGIFWPMCCSPFFDVWLLITSLWYLLTNVLFTLLWCMTSDYLPLVSFDQCVVHNVLFTLLWCMTSDYLPLVSFDQYVVHPSLMYDFWLPPFGIFWPMCCSPFFDVWLLITSLWYLLTNVLFTLLWCMTSDYLPLVSFDQCVVHPSLMYDFWLPPFGIFWPMCCSPFFDVWLLITSLWYLLTNVLFTLLWCMTSDYLPLVSFDQCVVHPSLMYDFWLPPLVSFDQCVVHPSLMYGFWLPPFGIFWPMCCSPFFDVWLLITSLWYLLTNVLFTLLWCMASDYLPLVSFDQCVVHPSLMYDFWLPPFGIFWPMCCSPFFDVWLLIAPLVSFDQCVVHPSLMYGFWLPPFGIFWPMCCSPFFDVWLLITSLWYLLTNVLFTLLWCMTSDCPFGIFWPMCCSPFFDVCMASDYLPLVSFDQCVVHPSLMYDFWLPPFGIFWPMCCSSFFDVWLLITSLWYLLTNVLFTLLWCMTSDYLPLVSFDQCVVHPSLMYDFWLPLWYLLTNMLFTLLWCMASDYLPLVSFDQCVVHPSLMYDFWLPPFGIFWPMCCSPFFDVWLLITSLWYLLTNVLFTLLWCMASDCRFGIFWPMCCSPFFDVWLLITSLWYLLTNVLFTLLWCMTSDYLPLVSFDQCVVHPSLMYDFWLPPFGIFWPMYCSSFFDVWTSDYLPLVSFDQCVVHPSLTYGFWLPPFGIFWPMCCSPFFDVWLLIAPLVSFDQCVVHPSLMYGFWLPPFGIFWPMCCPPFFDVWLLITSLWYLLTNVLFILLWCMTSDYLPLVSFDQCVVHPSLMYDFWLPPFGIFW